MKTYVPLVVFEIVAGDQVPEIPFGETNANVGAVEPEQKAGIGEKSGIVISLTVTVKVCVEAHCPALGVKT